MVTSLYGAGEANREEELKKKKMVYISDLLPPAPCNGRVREQTVHLGLAPRQRFDVIHPALDTPAYRTGEKKSSAQRHTVVGLCRCVCVW